MKSARRWAQESFGGADLGDWRRTQRFVQVMGTVAARPSGRISDVFRCAADRQGAYDFVEHESVSEEAVLGAVGEAGARACRGQRQVLVVLDGSSLTLTDWQASKGFGSIGARQNATQGLKVMNALALTPQGEVLGVPTQRYWVRTERAKSRGYRRVDERESVHWRRAVDEVSDRCAELAPETQLHFIADREADASLLLRRILERGHEFTIRANGTRPLRFGGRRVGLRPWLAQQPSVARMTLRLSAGAAGRERDACLVLRAARVPLVLRDRHVNEPFVRELTVVWAREQGRLRAGDRRVEWMLYTTDRAKRGSDACAVVERYSRRWRVEEMHRTWKSGACNVETTQLRSRQAAVKWASMLAAVAARIERLKTLSRTSPEQPATVELADVEIRALILLKTQEKRRNETIPDDTPTISQAVRWIADLGGYVGSKSSGPPGSTVIARGLERITIAAEILQALEAQALVKKIR